MTFDLERLNSRSLRFWKHISERSRVRPYVLLSIYGSESNGTTFLTLNDHEWLQSTSPRFQSLLYRKGAELGHMLLSKFRKSCMWSAFWPWKGKIRDAQILCSMISGILYGILYIYCWKYINLISIKRICLRVGVSSCPSSLLFWNIPFTLEIYLKNYLTNYLWDRGNN